MKLTPHLLCHHGFDMNNFAFTLLVTGPGSSVGIATDYVLDGKKGKAVLLQAWSGPEGSRKLRFPDYM